MTRIGIVGSRQFTDEALMSHVLTRFIASGDDITIISGGAKGADTLAERAAHARGFQTIIHHLDSAEAYKAFGNDFRARAFGRNGWIVRDSEYLIGFFVTPEPSGGTLNTLNQARRAGKTFYAHFPDGSWRTY